jgi:hypothetical protein
MPLGLSLSEGLGSTLLPLPEILDVFKLPHRFETVLDCLEAVTFVESAGAYVSKEGMKVERTGRLLLG